MIEETEAVISKQLQVTRIILIALVAGLAGFLGFALFQNQFAFRPLEKGISQMSWIALLMLAPATVAVLLMPRIITNGMLQKIATGKLTLEQSQATTGVGRVLEQLLSVRMTTLIIKLAILEGVGYMAAMAYFTDKDLMGLVMAASLLVAMLFHFPTASGLQTWLDQRTEELEAMTRNE